MKCYILQAEHDQTAELYISGPTSLKLKQHIHIIHQYTALFIMQFIRSLGSKFCPC